MTKRYFHISSAFVSIACLKLCQRESFHVKHSNLVEVCAQTDPDLPSLIIFYVSIEISKILDHEANWRRCPHGSVTASDGMTQERIAFFL